MAFNCLRLLPPFLRASFITQKYKFIASQADHPFHVIASPAFYGARFVQAFRQG
jgi:hypothetical protein